MILHLTSLLLKWFLTLWHPVFDLFQGNGLEEVVACAWDGQTYIIDHNRTVVRFQVDENIRAFCAGGTVPSELSYSSLVNVLESDSFPFSVALDRCHP